MKPKENDNRRTGNGFLAFLNSEIERQRHNGHISVANNYSSAAHSFSRFLKTMRKADMTFRRMTPRVISDYEAWLQTSGLCRNTTSFYIRALQSVYHKAVRMGLTDDLRPFSGTYRGVARTSKRAIDMSEVYHLSTLDIRSALLSIGDYGKGKRLDHMQRQLEFARDIFIFCFCARGLTFVDLAHMRKSDIIGNLLVYVRRKTKQRIEVQIEPMMQAVIERYPSNTDYLLPILTKVGNMEAVYQQYRYALGRYNANLDMLGMMLGGLKLTSYVSRHSWASAARQQHVPLSIISQSMGHDSEKTTEIYLKSLDCNVINKTNHDLLNNVFMQPSAETEHA
ncbi:MAG: site-specific integrase [Bacteroidaceae bacterium]|nr:site-specific integrase [Bacteroidaceae bacterium]